MTRSQPEGYQVLFLITDLGTYDSYTSKKRPLDLGMARAYRAHLERSGTGGRIIDLSDGKTVEEWRKPNAS
jgi:hypothetical protein